MVSEVQRKIGRNILLFQQLEYVLKYVIANGQLSGYSSDIEQIIASKRESVNRQTMGQLVGQFVENYNPTRGESSYELEELKEAHFSFDFRVETDEKSYENQKEALARLVLERNKLVHHFLPEFDPNSYESCSKVEKKLDDQADRVRIEVENILNFAQKLSDMRKEISDFLSSEDGKKELLLSFLRQDRLVILLAEISSQVAREDGWTLMSTAGQLVKQHAPDELELLHKGSEHKSLKSLMLKTEMFEFIEESTDKGGVRVLYKLKKEHQNLYF